MMEQSGPLNNEPAKEEGIMCTRESLSAEQKQSLSLLQESPTEENLWQVICLFQDHPFYTASGLPYHYKLKIGKNGLPTRELLIDRRQKSKTLAWSSVRLAFSHALERKQEEAAGDRIVSRPKALGDIRGISYIYPLFWKFGMIEVPEEIAVKMSGEPYQHRLFE